MAGPIILGKVAVPASDTDLFASPTSGATFSVRFVNNNASDQTIRCSISSTTATAEAAGRLVPDDFTVATGDALELSGLTIDSGKFLVISASSTDVNAIAYGWEA